MKIAERYSTARNTSNLKSDPRTRFAPTDVLMAVGMTAQEHEAAVMLWGVTYDGKTGAKHALVEIMAQALTKYMLMHGIKGSPVTIARETLAWWLHGICQHCHGRGYEVIPDSPTLSDVLCQSCHGTGKLPLPDETHRWMADRLAKWTAIAGGDAMRKLAGDMGLP